MLAPWASAYSRTSATAALALSLWKQLFPALGKMVFLVSNSRFELTTKMPKRFTSALVSLSKAFNAVPFV